MSNEKVNLNINVKNGGSKVGSFVTGGVMGAAVAGGAAYAATGELDGVISEIQIIVIFSCAFKNRRVFGNFFTGHRYYRLTTAHGNTYSVAH